MERGTGKTQVVVDLIGVLHLRFGITKVLVVAPLNALRVWRDEVEAVLNVPWQLAVFDSWTEPVVYGSGAVRIDVMTYAMAKLHRAALVARGYELVVADESHYIKNLSGRSRALWALGKAARFAIALTGTPAPRWSLDYWSQFQFFRPGVLPPTYGQMKRRFAVWGGYLGLQPVQWIHQDELQVLVQKYSFRVTKAEALDLPPQTIRPVTVRLGEEARRVLADLRAEMVAEYQGKRIITDNILVRLLRSSQICGGFLPDGDQIDGTKLKVVLDLVEELRPENVVVFCRFLPELSALHAALPDARTINGAVSRKRRTEIQDWFQAPGDGKVLLAQIQAGSEAVTLHNARYMIFYSLSWQAEHYLQALDRIHRIGQNRECIYYPVVAEGTIDSRLYGAIQKRDRTMRWLLEWLDERE